MRYKALLCGKSNIIMDDFFSHLEGDFEALTTSLRYEDILNHFRYFTPDVIVYCMHKETDDAMGIFPSLKSKLSYHHIPLVIVGNEEECEEFQKKVYKMADLVLTKPITIRNIGEKVKKLVDTWKAELEKEEAEKAAKALEAAEAAQKDSEIIDMKTLIQEQEKADSSDVQPAKPKVPEKKHILVVDDDPMMLKLIKEQLKDTYTVATAISGAIALKFLETKRTDLIILDYEMPGENGADVLKKIRDNDATSNLPVLFLTGISDREKIKVVLGFKPQGYLLKPIDREKLLEIIKKTIG